MADKATVFPRQQLEIVKVHEEKAYAGGSKSLLPVNATNLSLPEGDPLRGKSLKYTIFNQDLKTFVQGQAVGARFLCDIEERERPESEYGPDRNIVQIYQDGKPVSVKKPGGGYGKSPEIVRLEHELDLELEGVKRRSIEGQTAMNQVGNVLTTPTLIPGEDLGIDEEGWHRVVGKYWQAVERSLDNFLADQRPQDSKRGVEKAAAVSEVTPPVTDPIKHAGDLFTRAGKLDPPVGRFELIAALSVNEPSEIADLEAAWKMAQEMSASNRPNKEQ